MNYNAYDVAVMNYPLFDKKHKNNNNLLKIFTQPIHVETIIRIHRKESEK